MANKYVTVAGAGSKNGTDWDNAFGMAEWKTDLEGSATAGDSYFVKEGTYTLTANWDSSALDGTAASPISIIGVVSGTSAEPPTSSDWAAGTARPLLAQGTYSYKVGDYYILRNLRSTGSNFYLFNFVNACTLINYKVDHSSSGYGIDFQAGNILVDCEVTGSSCTGMRSYNQNRILGCYLHDCSIGLHLSYESGNVVMFCIFDTITNEGIKADTRHNTTVLNNTFYNCATGLEETTGRKYLVLNNVFSDCTTGIAWTTEQKSNYFDYNNYYNNSTDVSNITKGNNATAYEPQYTNAAGGDFSLNTASSCIGAAISISLGVG